MTSAATLDPRGRRLRAALGFLRLPATEPELVMLHRWLDTWTGVGLITVGVERQGMRLSLSHIADDEWRAMFMDDNARLAPRGFGVAATPWRAVQMAAWGGGERRDTVDEMVVVNEQWYTVPDARRYLREINPKLTDEEIEALIAKATVCRTPEEMKGPGVGLVYGVVTRRR